MPPQPKPDESNDYLKPHAVLLARSYRHWTGLDLIPPTSAGDLSKRLFLAPLVVVSHGTETDPIFNYGNLAALNLFEMCWGDFTRLPSRKSAEPVNHQERMRLLERVETRGYIDDYRGVRVSSSGRKFLITGAHVWNLIDDKGERCGQAACFSDWKFL